MNILALDLEGHKFGRLTVLEHVSGRMWKAACDCGEITQVRADHMKSGATQSCGCVERSSRISHGLSRSRVYGIWQSMLQRCHNPQSGAYVEYGAVGITVCERWHVFENFIKDMGEPADDQTLDRKKNHLGYSPENCRWRTYAEQNRNTARNVWIEHDGLRMCLSDWADRSGVPKGKLRWRLKQGWSKERALTP